ncbi:hypothetical protein Tsubulata_017435 [Turnera subulata]|uniref:Pollen Ole e 1 allergen and extensin family protein n=1 Tax=Turnera subulata TaxID=218843 RepID=A0A9Q0FVE1_9ROSI|nr:hypothetical protein Tsubulata_017435 [Turnera subulata]
MDSTARVLTLIAVSLLLVGFHSYSVRALEDTTGFIHVAGKVLCQDCTKGYNEWINGDRPIKGSKVSLTCMDERRRVAYFVSDVTDQKGQFDMSVSKYINGKRLNDKLCWVRLISSPDPTCNVFTDFGGGKSGVKLMRPTSVYHDTLKYVLTPLYFTTPMCEQPDTTTPTSTTPDSYSYESSHGTGY